MDFGQDSERAIFKQIVLDAIKPIVAPQDPAKASSRLFFSANRTLAGRRLSEYYLVYFLLVELLEFNNRGQSEKTAWSIPIEFNGEFFLIDHRKFGVGVFAEANKEHEAAEVTRLVNRLIRECRSPARFLNIWQRRR